MATLASASTSQIVTLPHIPELFNPDFLDVLVPAAAASSAASDSTKMDVSEAETESTAVESKPGNSFMNALKDSAKTGGLVRTDNADPAHGSTGSATLDAFQALAPQSNLDKLPKMLGDAWKEDPDLTLRMIWNARSIHDGKGERKLFYSAYFWLFEHHTRTAIANLSQLVEPVCKQGKAEEGTLAHGYYKDLLNILAFAFHGGDNVQEHIATSGKQTKKGSTEKKKVKGEKTSSDEKPSEAPVLASKAERATSVHNTIDKQLAKPSLRALFIAVVRLFASRLAEDLTILTRVNAATDKDEAYSLTKNLSLAGKWAPSPGAGHDRTTNISSAIALLLFSSGALKQGDASSDLNQQSAVPAPTLHALRASYQRHILAPLRKALALPEPLMSTGKWKEIHYPRVASEAMKLHTARFLQHDEAGFEKYLTDVESGKKVISGATLMPHILVGDVVELDRAKQASTSKAPADAKDGDKPRSKAQILADVKAKLADTQLRVMEAQWKTLLNRLRGSGSLEGSLAICDVSGSMGSVYHGKPTKEHTQPIYPAVALSLLVAQVAKPPFAGGFVSFSAKPQYLEVEVDGSLAANVTKMVNSDWGMSTDFRAVFLDLLLPIAVKHKVKPEDMIKRLFVFSDMQFDQAHTGNGDQWRTSHESIVKAYKEAGYEVPEMVYWNLAAQTDKKALRPMPVTAETPGVALMNGFSPAMLKVFMGDENLEEEGDWEMMEEDGAAPAAAKETQAMDPISVMKKALNKGSFGGLKVLD